MFIGLNPSTADGEKDDATIRKLIKYTKSWNYGGFFICNLFTKVTPHSETLPCYSLDELVGKDSDYHLKIILNANDIDKIVFMWGNNNPYPARSNEIIRLYGKEAYCFERSKAGNPKHPLYLPSNTQLIKWLQ